MEKDKVKTIIQIDRQVWSEVKKEAFLKGETVSQVVERKLIESFKASKKEANQK
ncbi:MAG: hypothetical protein QXQ50_02165 [Candidatus Bathyarchaeia archaeon]